MHAESSIEETTLPRSLGVSRHCAVSWRGWGGSRRSILTELTAASVRRALFLRRSVLPYSPDAPPCLWSYLGRGDMAKWRRMKQLTDLVEDLLSRVWECHRFLEDLSGPVQTLTFRPVVESARHVDLFRIMGPVMPCKNRWLADSSLEQRCDTFPSPLSRESGQRSQASARAVQSAQCQDEPGAFGTLIEVKDSMILTT
jgi:hypothetical protein